MAGDCGSTCPVSQGFYNAKPNIGANGALVGLFGALVPLALFYGLRYRIIAFSGILSTGCLLNALGFLGRILLNNAPTSQGYFLLSLLGTVLGPVFTTVAAFDALPHVLNVYGERLSPIPSWIVAVALYISSFVAGLLQLIGLCLAVFPPAGNRDVGTSLVAGGLGVQLAALLGFSAIYVWFRVGLRARQAEIDPKHSALYESVRFRRFLLSIQLTVLALTGYSTYRIAEMSQGIAGSLFQNQYVTCFLDGLVVWLAAFLLLLPHPGYTFRAAWAPTSAFRAQKQRRRAPPTPLSPMHHLPEGYKTHARYDPNIRSQISPISQRSQRSPRSYEPHTTSPGLPSNPRATLKLSPVPSPTGTLSTIRTNEKRASMRTERRSNPPPPKKLVEEDVLW